LGTRVTNQNCIHEEIKNRWIWGMFATILFTIFCLPVSSKILNIKTYKTMILPVVLYGCETWSHTLREGGCLRTECWGKYLDLSGRKWQETGEDYIMRSFIVGTLHQIILGWLNQGGWMGRAFNMKQRDKKCIPNFVWKTWREQTI